MEFAEESSRDRLSSLSSYSEESENRLAALSARRSSELSDTNAETMPARRLSIYPGVQRRFSRSVANYVSPYSTWKNLQGKVDINQKEEEKQEQKPTMENTYRMEPKKKLPEGETRKIIQQVLQNVLATQRYDGNGCGLLTKMLSSRILDQVKDLNAERYKLVCFVNITSKHNQGLQHASRCLWNPDFDTFVSVTFENESLYAVANVYGVYFE